MAVHIGEPDPAWVGACAATGTTRATRAKEAAEHNAAIAADDDEEAIVVETCRDTIGERSAVGGHARLVPGLAGRALKVLVGRRLHVAEVRRVQPLYESDVPKRRGGAIHLLRAHRSRRAAGGRCSMGLP